MRLVFTSFSHVPDYNNPQLWLKRIDFYTGILEALAKDHKVFSIERINFEGELKQKGVHYIFRKQEKKVSKFPIQLHHHIKSLKPDVVFLNGFNYPLQTLQLKLFLGKNVRMVVLHRAEKPFTGIKGYLQKLADKCISYYLFTSDEFQQEWKKNIDIRKIREVIQASSHFYPTDKYAARRKLSIQEKTTFLWVGRLDQNKDPITVVNTFLKFNSINPETQLYMIYQSDELLAEVKKRISNSNSTNIHLVGKIPHDELMGWYNASDFIISGSHYEGSGIVISEAMSCGCIPIVTNIPSLKRMTGPGKCGLLYKAGNEDELLNALKQTSEFDIRNERDKTLHQFQTELSFEAIAKKINSILEAG